MKFVTQAAAATLALVSAGVAPPTASAQDRDAEWRRKTIDEIDARQAAAARLARGPFPAALADPERAKEADDYFVARGNLAVELDQACMRRMNRDAPRRTLEENTAAGRQCTVDRRAFLATAVDAFRAGLQAWADRQPPTVDGLLQLREAESKYQSAMSDRKMQGRNEALQAARAVIDRRRDVVEPQVRPELLAIVRRTGSTGEVERLFGYGSRQVAAYEAMASAERNAAATAGALRTRQASIRIGPDAAMMASLLARTYLDVRPAVRGLGLAKSLLIADNEVGLDMGFARQSYVWDARDVRCRRRLASGPFTCAYQLRVTGKMSVFGNENAQSTGWIARSDAVSWTGQDWSSPTVAQMMRQVAAEQARNAPPAGAGPDAGTLWCRSFNKGLAAVGRYGQTNPTC